MPPKEPTGNVARQMAAAPMQPEGQTEPQTVAAAPPVQTAAPAEAAKTVELTGWRKRFAGIYNLDNVLFNQPRTQSKTYDENGRKSRKVALVAIEIGNTGLYQKGHIYAVQLTGAKKAKAEFSFLGSTGQSSVGTEDAQCKADLDGFKAEVAKKYGMWVKENPIALAAAAADQEEVELDGIQL